MMSIRRPGGRWLAVAPLSKAIDQVEALDAAGGPAPFLTLGVEDEGGAVELFDQTARRQPEDAEGPARRAHDDHRGGIVELYHLGFRFAYDLGGQLLALRILILPSLGQRS